MVETVEDQGRDSWGSQRRPSENFFHKLRTFMNKNKIAITARWYLANTPNTMFAWKIK
jgi:hypothetical protein